jgi:two-component system, LytTR family, response regulator
VRLDRILVVDDEAPARRHLVRMLRELAELADVLEASSVEAAAAIIAANPALDCIFLDVQMPVADGFALFERCAITAPVVFVTAYHQHAVRAFEVNALDYLLKPISRDRLVEAMRRLQAPRALAAQAFTADDVVWLHERGRQSFVRLAEIVYIAAADDYTELHLADGTSRLCALTMRDWETRAPATFARIHRSTIVGTTHVVELRYAAAGASVVMRGVAEPLRVARTHLAALKARLDP